MNYLTSKYYFWCLSQVKKMAKGKAKRFDTTGKRISSLELSFIDISVSALLMLV